MKLNKTQITLAQWRGDNVPCSRLRFSTNVKIKYLLLDLKDCRIENTHFYLDITALNTGGSVVTSLH